MRQGWRRVLTASGRSYCLAHEIWPLYTLRGHKDSINAVAFLPNERILAFSPNRRSFASSSAAGIPWDVEFGLHPNRPPVVRFIWEALSTEGARLLVQPRIGNQILFDALSSSNSRGENCRVRLDFTAGIALWPALRLNCKTWLPGI